MDKCREEFESEMAKLGDCVDMRRAKNGDEEYMAWDVGLAWRMWKASRENIVIHIDSKIYVEDDFDAGHNTAIDYCVKDITDAGLKVEFK